MKKIDKVLCECATTGDIAGIDAALAQGASLHNPGSASGMNALQHAALAGKHQAFAHLLALGARVNDSCGHYYSPLGLAVANSHPCVEIVEAALKAGAHANARMSSGTTVLHLATISGCAPAVELLLQYGADAQVLDPTNSLPLHHAAKEGHAQVLLILARLTRDLELRNTDNWRALDLAVLRGQRECVNILRALGVSTEGAPRVNDKLVKLLDASPLECAVASRRPDVLAACLQRQPDIAQEDLAAAARSARKRRQPEMEAILQSWSAQRCARESLACIAPGL